MIGNGTTPLATKVYDEDGGTAGDTTIQINSRLNNGQGTGTADMTLMVPKSLFSNNLPYVVLYSAFGDPNGNAKATGDGFYPSTGGHEDWNADIGPTSPVPLPPSLYAGAGLLGAFGLVRLTLRGQERTA